MVDLFKVTDPSESLDYSITAREILDKGTERIEIELTDQPAIQLEPGSGPDIEEFLIVGITEESGPAEPAPELALTSGFSDYFQ